MVSSFTFILNCSSFFQEGLEGFVFFYWEGQQVLLVVVGVFASAVAFDYGFGLDLHQAMARLLYVVCDG